MKYKILKICFYSAGLMILYSCDPAVNTSKIVQNSSEYNLLLIVENPDLPSSMASPDSVVNGPQNEKMYFFRIPSQSKKTISFFSDLGTVDMVKDCGIKADLLRFDTTKYSITRDITESTNWNKTGHKKNYAGGGDVTCTFELKSSDVIRK